MKRPQGEPGDTDNFPDYFKYDIPDIIETWFGGISIKLACLNSAT